MQTSLGAAIVNGPRTNAVSVTATGRWSIYRWGWQFFSSEAVDEAYVSFFGAFGATWDDAMVNRWSANPLGMLWPVRDAAFVTSGGGNGGGSAAPRRPVVIVAVVRVFSVAWVKLLRGSLSARRGDQADAACTRDLGDGLLQCRQQDKPSPNAESKVPPPRRAR